MSYEIVLIPKSGSLSTKQFRKLFEKRRYFSIKADQAMYYHERTFVEFNFERQRDLHTASECIVFRLNLPRAHYWAKEAAIELQRLSDTGDFDFHDTQTDEIRAYFDAADFQQRWQESNQIAVTAIKRLDRHFVEHTLPKDRLDEIWNWNYNADRRQAELGAEGHGVFVPAIMFQSVNGRVKTFCTWPVSIPVLLPQVDYITIGLTRRPEWFFCWIPPSIGLGHEMFNVAYNDIAPTVHRFQTLDGAIPSKLLSYNTPPPDVLDALHSLARHPIERNGIAEDQILTAV